MVHRCTRLVDLSEPAPTVSLRASPSKFLAMVVHVEG